MDALTYAVFLLALMLAGFCAVLIVAAAIVMVAAHFGLLPSWARDALEDEDDR